MRLSDFDFDLPPDLIAQRPLPERHQSRLMVLARSTGLISHHTSAQLPDLLERGDLLVLNNSRVIPARLYGRRVPSGGHVECLLLRRIGADAWDALVHPGQKLKVGAVMVFERRGHRLYAEVIARGIFGRRTVRLWREDDGDIEEAIDRIGEVPLPPYIKRAADENDRERYQTIYATARGSVAAPTAGLHLTGELLRACAANGIGRAEVTLHVGYGTFAPVRAEQIEEHRIDPEPFEIPAAASHAIEQARAEHRRIVAVGTTTTRTLEAVARDHDGRVPACTGEASLFIHPGFQFKVVGALMTNFHLPKSSLLMLVSAFAGHRLVRRAYHEAVAERYRFYSYGDAMLIL
jgi:S-adenosylmethionine:tRNA ribosyltransferase-isomerase